MTYSKNLIDRPRYTCTLGGALGTLKALPGKVVPIIHAAPGCGGNLGYTISLSAAYAGSGYASNCFWRIKRRLWRQSVLNL